MLIRLQTTVRAVGPDVFVGFEKFVLEDSEDVAVKSDELIYEYMCCGEFYQG